jgi:hypothetical protein
MTSISQDRQAKRPGYGWRARQPPDRGDYVIAFSSAIEHAEDAGTQSQRTATQDQSDRPLDSLKNEANKQDRCPIDAATRTARGFRCPGLAIEDGRIAFPASDSVSVTSTLTSGTGKHPQRRKLTTGKKQAAQD